MDINIEQQLTQAYNDPTRGFRSAKRLWELVRKKIPGSNKWIPPITLVKEWINNQAAHSVHTPQIVKTYFPIRENRGTPFQRMQMDIMFPDKKEGGMSCILMLIDTYTRYILAYPMKGKTANDVIEAFKKALYEIQENLNQFLPLQIDCDNEGAFYSTFLRKIAEDNNINFNTNQVGDHKALAFIDRATRTFRTLISKYNTAADTTDWLEVLPKLVENYNTTPHSSTKESPLAMVKDVVSAENPNPLGQINENERMNKQEAKASLEPWAKRVFKVGDQVRIPVNFATFTKKTKPRWKTKPETITDMIPAKKLEGGVYYYVSNNPGIKFRKYELLPIKDNKFSPYLSPTHNIGRRERELEEQHIEKKVQEELQKINQAKPNVNEPRQKRANAGENKYMAKEHKQGRGIRNHSS